MSSGYLFLQRTLGELHTLEGRKARIIQTLIQKLHAQYEEV